MATIGNLVVKIGADISGLSAGLDTAADKVKNFGRSTFAAGGALTAGVTLPLAAMGAAAVSASTDLNAAMANVASLGIPADRVNELKVSVQEMAVATGKSTSDLAGGLYQVISAFGDTADTAKILEINAKSAAAGLATTEEAIALTSAVTKGYGDTSAAAVQKASDLALLTVQLGQTTFPELAGSIGTVVPLAASLGVKMEDLYGVMATATGVTGGASEVATQFRGILQSLMAPTKDMSALFKELGYSSGVVMLEQLGLQGTIATIVQSAETANMPLQKLIGSIEGQTLALALAGPQADVFTQKLAAMQTASGATDAAFLAQTQGINKLGFSWQQLQVRLEVIAQRMGDSLGPAMLAVLDAMEPLLVAVEGAAAAFAAMDPNMQLTIISILGIVAAIGPVLMAIGAMATGVGALMSAAGVVAPVLAALGAAIAAIGWPITLVIAAITALSLAWQTNFLGIQDITAQAWVVLQDLFAVGVAQIQLWLGEFMAGIDALGALVQTVFTGIGVAVQTVQAIWVGVLDVMAVAVEPVIAAITALQDAITAFRDWAGGLSMPNPFAGISVPQFSAPSFSMPSLPTLPGFAEGTSSYPGGWGIVGERGPELVKLPRGSEILPNDATAALGGGVTVYANVSGDVDVEVLAQRVLDVLRRRGR